MKEVKNETIKREKSESQLQKLVEEKSQVQESLSSTIKVRNELQTKVFDLTREKEELETARLEVEGVCVEFREEANKSIGDYKKLASEYEQVAMERDAYRVKREKAMNTLAKRKEEMDELEKRVKMLEKERDELISNLTLMDTQVC